MSYSHVFEPVILLAYHEAIAWYGERSFSAADNFVTAVSDKIENICANPTLYRSIYKNTREVSLKKFPYSIFYFTDEAAKQIVIASSQKSKSKI